jgi:ATP-dependent protease ClpP protease subunit
MNSINLYLQDKIDVETVRPLIQRIIEENTLLEVEKEDELSTCSADLINLYITSVGGSVHDGFALTDVILNSKIPINTYCVGYADSTAFFVYLAGKERYAYEHSMFLIHNILSSIEDSTPTGLKSYTDYVEKLQNWEYELFEQRTGKDYTLLYNVFTYDKQLRLTAQEALEHNIVTKII